MLRCHLQWKKEKYISSLDVKIIREKLYLLDTICTQKLDTFWIHLTLKFTYATKR